MIFQCPGAKRFKQPQPESIRCETCGREIEIWSDEVTTKCPGCKQAVTRKSQESCLDWCRYAKECAGDEVYRRYLRDKTVSIRQKLMGALEKHFGGDQKKIDHARDVAQYAEEILRNEPGDWHIVIPASILHDLGNIAGGQRGRDAAGAEQARRLMLTLGFQKQDIDEICSIIEHHHSPDALDTRNFKILCDADSLVNFKDHGARQDARKISEAIERTFLTKTAKELARKKYL